MSELDPSIAALIAKLDSWAETCRNPPCDFDRPQPFIAQLLESAASALRGVRQQGDLSKEELAARSENQAAVGRLQSSASEHEVISATAPERLVWRPIETAPKEPGETSRHILVWMPMIQCTAIAVRDSAESPWLHAFSNGRRLFHEVTHWMPIPPAPDVDGGPREMPMPDMPATPKDEPDNLARASGDASAMAPEETMECSICHERVAAEQTDEHLATAHPTPPEGFQFFYDGQAYRTDRPSMQVSELLTLVNGGRTYQFYEDRDGALIPLSHAQAVDLTNGPRRFFSIPPATGN